jgi:glycosyltransferase involved in cell wall biosynthesis
MTDKIRILGLTNMRIDEMRAPFEELDDRTALLTVDPDDGIRAYLSVLVSGSRHIERHDTDVILTYNGTGLLGAVGMLLSRYYKIPHMIRLNGDIYRQHREKTLELLKSRDWKMLATYLPFTLLTRAVFSRADSFLPVTSALTKTIHRQTDCPTERIVPVPNPVRADEYAPPETEDGPQDGDESQQLLTVTNLNFRGKYEGVTELLDGVVPVLRRRPEVEYVIAGDGRYYERLNWYLEKQMDDDVRRRIRTPGFVKDVASLYWEADVFLYASYIDGYPNVILEAQAAGLPIVTYPTYGISEQIDDDESGIFVEPSEPNELARTISRLLDDSAERDRLGRNASARVETENDPDVIGSWLYEAVRTVLTGREPRNRPKDHFRRPMERGTRDESGRLDTVRGGFDE